MVHLAHLVHQVLEVQKVPLAQEDVLARLDHLDLSFNELRRLGNRSLVGLEYLPYLALSGNRLDRLSRSALRPLRSVDILDLRLNYLTHVTNQFANLTSLTNLASSLCLEAAVGTSEAPPGRSLPIWCHESALLTPMLLLSLRFGGKIRRDGEILGAMA